ncbi:hypothetical protein J7U46_10495 [Pelomonas sp. V22]|uniref:hypothetical protein n=1 Tax=Pelomonas sp. V22 TaxID=2822139 RepID=UPI0024A8C1BD|nr:hypothetical protein [Pelomonas sp. V22]MDI4633478.1 hypothetical protein [Pelomonas sp. V22]
MYFPARLVEHIRNRIPEFSELPLEHQHRIAMMLWNWSSGSRRHCQYNDFMPFTKDQSRKLWGSDASMRRVLGHRYFVVVPGDNLVGWASGFKPAPALKQALDDCLDDRNPDDLHRPDGRVLRSPPRAIRSRDANNNNAKWAGATCANLVRVNRSELERMANCASEEKHRRAARHLLKLSYNHVADGFVPVSYEQKSSGRLYMIIGGVQTIHRDARNAALVGYWDYDIENCHFSILRQMAAAVGVPSPTIDTYLANKRAIRAGLMAITNAPKDDVKEALIALLYGARLSHSTKTALGKLFKPSALGSFLADPFVKALAAEIRAVRKAVLATQSVRRGKVINAMGLEIDPAEADEGQVLCHLLQGIEAKALRAVLRQYGRHVLLAMHDGWVSCIELDSREIESLISKVTGYRLELDAKRIAAPEIEYGNETVQFETPGEHKFFNTNQQLTGIDAGLDATSSVRAPSHRSGLHLSVRPQWNCPPGVTGTRPSRSQRSKDRAGQN